MPCAGGMRCPDRCQARGGSNNKSKQVIVLVIILLLQQWGKYNVMASASSNSDGSTTTAGTVSSLLRCVSKWMMMVEEDRATRPFVTLSFAQSLDGKIALSSSSSSNFPISCPESLIWTHALRSVHDAVLVGSETMRTDNPRLTVRLWGECLPNPRPVVLDTHLRCDYTHCRAKNLIVCCSEEAVAARGLDDKKRDDTNITLLPCTVSSSSSHLDLRDVLGKLRMKFGIHSIMVEGGARVLSNFLNEELADCMCVTISPMVLGLNGLTAFQHLTNAQEAPALSDVVWKQIGVDSILLRKIQ